MGCLVVISGKARVGKDTFATMLARELQKIDGSAYVLMAYAHELKLRVQKDFDLTYEQLWGSEKEVPDERYVKKTVDTYWAAREIMQEYGSFFRSINNDFWVDCLFKTIDDKGYNNVIITDGRYPNEIKPVLDRGGVYIRVERDNKESITNELHSSELALDNDDRADFVVNNNGTLEELEKTAEEVAKVINTLIKSKGE